MIYSYVAWDNCQKRGTVEMTSYVKLFTTSCRDLRGCFIPFFYLTSSFTWKLETADTVSHVATFQFPHNFRSPRSSVEEPWTKAIRVLDIFLGACNSKSCGCFILDFYLLITLYENYGVLPSSGSSSSLWIVQLQKCSLHFRNILLLLMLFIMASLSSSRESRTK